MTSFFRLGVWVRWLLAPIVFALPFFNQGCATTEAPGGTGVASHPEAVVIDFYSGGHRTGACSGTLIAQNVVLTAAHCADDSTAARVTAPGAGGKTATVSRIHVFDWTPHDPSMNPSQRYDAALLVLRSAIKLGHYARLEPDACFGCKVTEVSRDPRGKSLLIGAAKRTAATTPTGHPLNLFVRNGAESSGGPVYRTQKGRTDVVVGITVGKGAATGGGYITPLSSPDVKTWVRAVLHSVSRPAQGTASSSNALTHPLDDGTDDYGDPSAGDYSDPYADPGSSDPGYGDPGYSDPNTDPGTGDPGTDPGYGDPGTDPGYGDPGTDPGYGDPGTDPGYGDPGGDPGTGDPNNDPGTGDPGNDVPTAPDQAEQVDQTGQVADDGQGGDKNADPAANDAPSPSDEYNSKTNAIVSGGDEQTQCNAGGSSCVSFAPKDAEMAKDGLAVGAALNDKGADYFGSHGSPGVLWSDNPDAANAAAADAAADGKPLIVGACYASTPGPNGTSAIQDLADQNGLDRSQIYGCTYLGAVQGDQLLCAGDWKDGNGNFVSRADREKYGLQSCAVSNLNLNDGTANFSKCSYDLSGDPDP